MFLVNIFLKSDRNSRCDQTFSMFAERDGLFLLLQFDFHTHELNPAWKEL